MNLSRREFLARAVVAIAARGIPLGAETDGDVFRNHRLGLEVRKPPGWDFASIADFVTLRNRQVLEGFEFEEGVPWDPSVLPIFFFEDSRRRLGEESPGIVLYEESVDWDLPIGHEEEVSEHTTMLRGFSKMFRDLVVLEEPRRAILNGDEGSVATWSYVHVVDDGTVYPRWVRSVLVFRPPVVHTFMMVDRLDRTVPNRIWENFLQSIRYSSGRALP